jgi:hypothetical protein
MIDQVSGHEIRILSRNTGPAEIDHRLRHIEADFDPPPKSARRNIGDRKQIGLFRQRAESAIEQYLERLGVDIADHRDL